MVSIMSGRTLRLCAAAVALVGSGACAPLVIGASALTSVGVAQERSTRDAFSDFDIQAHINGHLLDQSPELFRRVGVESVEGRVVLTGAVSRHDHALKATEIAWTAPGVKSVTNELTIDGDPSFRRFSQDLWITTQLNAKMLGDPQVASINYTIETHRGVVHLLGLARSEPELERVTRLAASIPGVTQVVSHVLVIDDPRRQRV
jgi:osmotically-inducible protein OsmY